MFSLSSSLFLVVALIIVSYFDADCATGGATSISVLRSLKQQKGKRSIYSLSLPSSEGNTNPNDAHANQDDLDKRFLPGLTANWEDKRLFEPVSEEVEEDEDHHRKKRGEDNDYYVQSVEMPWRAKRSSSSACKDKDKGRRFLLQAGCKKDDYKLCECYSEGFARCTECKYNKTSFGKK